jgi:hypothetical protein
MAKNEDTPAKWAVIKEWDAWVSKHGEEARIGDGMFFFAYLQRECPDLLDFKYPGDKWQAVHGWLLREGRVRPLGENESIH